jgi:hypothetical protein
MPFVLLKSFYILCFPFFYFLNQVKVSNFVKCCFLCLLRLSCDFCHLFYYHAFHWLIFVLVFLNSYVKSTLGKVCDYSYVLLDLVWQYFVEILFQKRKITLQKRKSLYSCSCVCVCDAFFWFSNQDNTVLVGW